MDIRTILAGLNTHQIRATYGAVGELLGIPAIGVGRYLGDPRAEASWVVSADHSESYSDLWFSIMRTARSRNSGEYRFDLFVAPSSQDMEPPTNPGRFIA